MGLIRFLVIFFVFYFLFKLLARYLFPLLRIFFNSNDNNNIGSKNERIRQEAKKKEGQITIKYNPEKEQKNQTEFGEYTDYEEIKD